MAMIVDIDDVYKEITKYYHHKTDIQHAELRNALSHVKQVSFIPADIDDLIDRNWAIEDLERYKKELNRILGNDNCMNKIVDKCIEIVSYMHR